MTTGEKVLIIRQHLGLTQQQFSDRINKTSGYISRVESNKSQVSDRTIQDICDVFKVKREFFSSDCSSSSPEDIFYEAEFYEPVDPKIYNRVRMIRKDRNLTQKQFADLLGCSLVQVKLIETQKRNPSVPWLKNASAKLNVSLDWLQNGRGDMKDQGAVDKEKTNSSDNEMYSSNTREMIRMFEDMNEKDQMYFLEMMKQYRKI